MTDIIEVIKLFGGIAGLTALGLKFYEELVAYLKINVKVDSKDKIYSIYTEIENTSKWSRKKIENAFLIISPEYADLIDTGNKIVNHLNLDIQIEKTDDFERITGKQSIYFGSEIAFIPLSFYYNENIAIGDEKISYRCSVESSKLKSGNYSVRFYIFGENRYLRSTQDLLTITTD